MKKRREQWLRMSTRALSGVLALLGFAACDSGDSPGADEYGTPYAKYELKGKVTDEARIAISNARVIVKTLEQKSDVVAAYSRPDTLQTGQDGTFDLNKTDFPRTRYRVVCEDLSGVYKADSTYVQMEPKGGKGWYAGTDTKEVNFNLKKK